MSATHQGRMVPRCDHTWVRMPAYDTGYDRFRCTTCHRWGYRQWPHVRKGEKVATPPIKPHSDKVTADFERRLEKGLPPRGGHYHSNRSGPDGFDDWADRSSDNNQ